MALTETPAGPSFHPPPEGFRFPREKEIYVKKLAISSSDSSTVFEIDENIQVCARLKPVPPNQQTSSYTAMDNNTLRFRKIAMGETRDTCYKFNHVFGPEVTQNTLYKQIIETKVENFLKGGNVLIFSYGTTSSGKTYTIQGNARDPGIIPRSLLQIFKSLDGNIDETMSFCPSKSSNLIPLTEDQLTSINNEKDKLMHTFLELKTTCPHKGEEIRKSLSSSSPEDILISVAKDIPSMNVETISTKYSLWVSFIEVYNENIFDLLDYSTGCERKPLRLAWDIDKANYIKDLNHYLVSSWSEAWKLFMCGRNKLHMTYTKLNQSSSRSHSIFTLKMVKRNQSGYQCNSFTICDLAGTERQKKVQNEGHRLRETLNINTSLMVLNRCLSIMRENQLKKAKQLVPYRDSKLTQIFKNSLLSNDKILMIINISQCDNLIEETQQVLKMSAIAKDIVVSRPHKSYRNPKSRFSIFCSTGFGIPPSTELLNGDASKENEFQDDPKVLKIIISNLEQQLKDQEVMHQCKLNDLAAENKNLRRNCYSLRRSGIDDAESVVCSTFIETKKRKLDDKDWDFNFQNDINKEYSELLQTLANTQAQLATKSNECHSLRCKINTLEHKLNMQNENKIIQNLIQDLIDQDSRSAMEKLLKEKNRSDSSVKVLESVMEEARVELLSLEEKLNETEAQLNEKCIENEDLLSELRDKNNLLLRNSEVIEDLDKQNEKLKQAYLEMEVIKKDLEKKVCELTKCSEEMKDALMKEKNKRRVLFDLSENKPSLPQRRNEGTLKRSKSEANIQIVTRRNRKSPDAYSRKSPKADLSTHSCVSEGRLTRSTAKILFREVQDLNHLPDFKVPKEKKMKRQK